MMKSLRVFFLFVLSWLVSVKGKWAVPRGHRLCPVKPVNCHVAGLRLSFHLSGRKQKQFS